MIGIYAIHFVKYNNHSKVFNHFINSIFVGVSNHGRKVAIKHAKIRSSHVGLGYEANILAHLTGTYTLLIQTTEF